MKYIVVNIWVLDHWRLKCSLTGRILNKHDPKITIWFLQYRKPSCSNLNEFVHLRGFQCFMSSFLGSPSPHSTFLICHSSCFADLAAWVANQLWNGEFLFLSHAFLEKNLKKLSTKINSGVFAALAGSIITIILLRVKTCREWEFIGRYRLQG